MKFEDYLKENFNDRRTEVDADQVWEAVADRIDDKKKKRPFYWIFFGLCLMFCVVYVVDGFGLRDNLNVGNNEQFIASGVKHTAKESITEPYGLSQNLSPTPQEKQPIKEIIRQNNFGSSQKEKRTQKNTTSSSPSIEQYDIRSTFTNTQADKPLSRTINKVYEINTNNFSNSTQNSQAVSNNAKNKNLPTLTQGFSIANIQLLPKAILSEFSLEKRSYSKEVSIDDPSALKKDRKFKWWLGLNLGAGLSSRNLTSDDLSYQSYRNDYEKTLENITTEVEIGYQLSPKWSLQSGLNLMIQTEKFEWEGNYPIQMNGVHLSGIYHPNETESIELFTDGPYEQSVHREMKIYNHYKIWSLPIKIAYTHALGKSKLRFSPGMLLNLGIQSKGYVLNNLRVPTLLGDIDNTLSLQYMMSLSYEKELNSRWGIMIGTDYRYIPQWKQELPSNLVVNSSSYHFANASVGLKYRL